MSGMFVGRVGGLAVALGIGAVAFNGAAPAWADTDGPADQSTTAAESAAPKRSSDGDTRGSRQRAPLTAVAPSRRSDDDSPTPGASTRPRSAAPAADLAEDTPDLPAAAELSAPDIAPSAPSLEASQATPAPALSAPALVQAPVVAPAATAAAPLPAPASGALADVALADLLGGGDPAVPVNTPAEWAALAVARRGNAATLAQPAAAEPFAADPGPVPMPGGCSQTSTACTLILGPSGVPIPTALYALTVSKFYISPNSPFESSDAQIVFTPEGAYPVTGIKTLPLPISVEEGLQILIDTIQQIQPGGGPSIPINIFGFSQSAVIGSLLQRKLQEDPTLLPGLDRSQLTFVSVGQEMNPNGGWFARFPGLNTPSLGEYFYGSTGYQTADSTGDPQFAYPVVNYSLQYDGFADSPRYAGNFLASLNAALGILLVHTNYGNEKYFQTTYKEFDPLMAELGPGLACQQGATSCIELPVKQIDGQPQQKYYLIQTPNLPLLAPLRALPLIGKPLAALIEPALKVIVDLGYADPAHGFESATQPFANLALPFGILPQVSPLEVLQKLGEGIVQGVEDFFGSFGAGGSVAQDLAAIADSFSAPFSAGALTIPAMDDVLTSVQNIVTEISARISAGASALYATLLATADFINAGVITLPAYGVTLAIDGIKQVLSGDPIGGLINAIGRPIAASAGLLATIIVVQVTVWLEGVLAAITGCGPAAPTAGLCLIESLA
jgi:hypothetical protein